MPTPACTPGGSCTFISTTIAPGAVHRYTHEPPPFTPRNRKPRTGPARREDHVGDFNHPHIARRADADNDPRSVNVCKVRAAAEQHGPRLADEPRVLWDAERVREEVPARVLYSAL
jgi:hypothetical protein